MATGQQNSAAAAVVAERTDTMSPLPLSAESILYPKKAKNDTMRKTFKQKLLEERPETLFADLYKNGDVSNLIFLTDQPNAWRSAVCSHYPCIKKEGICNGWKLKIKETDDPDSTMITINLYKTGTVMVQGNIRLFETDFQTIKERAEREKDTTSDMPSHKRNSTSTTLTPTLPTQTSTSSTSLPTIVEDTPQEESDPLSAEQAQALLTTMAAMRDEFTKLEGEVVLLRESVSKQQPDNHTLEELLTKVRTEQDSSLATQLKEVQQERDGLKRELADLTKEVRELQKDRQSSNKELTALREELQERKRAEDRLQEQIDHHPMTCPHTAEEPSSTSQTSPALAAASLLPNPQNSLPLTVAPTQTSHTPAPTPTSPPSAPPNPEETLADIVLLMDSNGKYVQEKKLFPRHKTRKVWCPTTQSAMELLDKNHLGSPSHIIIHTGSNDLRAQQERVATSLRGVIEKASAIFPNTRIIVSTLLQRRDFHPATIQRINASLSRDCALRPNVHLAHHPTLDLDCLYDHVHLYRETVPILAKTLKDVALNRSPTSPPRNSRAISTLPRSPRQHPGPAPWTPQPRPQHHQPQCPPQPAQHRPPQPSFRATQTRPPTPLPPTADPHLEEPQPSRQSYAQAVRGATGPAPTNQMSDIKQMLSLLCSHVMGRGSW
ncbi:uncharacterized protein [Salvelinus alpinus]|uniref:uncharacterized protein n=1 Tax=Salvelinus alpinus TaxID=8036 RepID=UPI0039FCB779